MRRPLSDLGVQPNPDVVAQRVQDEVVLVNLRTNEIYTLNRTAARAWELLAEGGDRSSIEATLTEEFSADSSAVGGELDGLLEELLAKELIQRA
jgi:Coenzyme PQQ synthesis protein D (PqqD)